ncbi:hypothetical protein BFP97_15645 [Roseivirga sp. 4D4]|uniref:DUF5723 family protein n=1 Tax=Roseivirga sp. 4D4 TaxID=1889784 RepID=UPI000852EFD2|nr:DUF5723 family protein [Roseivirga sp. 4D4]OEK02869.1 hypothetical protein BFP97_15645 [Roseivirga sp. 4D4]
MIIINRRIFFLTLILIGPWLKAQEFNGFIQSDFSGVLGARVQPASIADSPYKFDFSLINGNYYLTNNIGFTRTNAEGTSLIRFLDLDPRFLHANLDVGGLSAMLSLPRNQGIALQFQLRSVSSINDLSPQFITQVNRFTDMRFLNTTVTNQKGDFATSLWQEVALSYAFVKKDDGFHRWKVGATFKLINPLANVWASIQDIDYNITGSGLAQFNNLEAELGYSSTLDEFEQFDGTQSFNRLPKGTGFKPGGDIGVVYERVAHREDPRGNRETRLKPDITYEFRLGISITDIGVMKFDQGSAAFAATGILPNQGDINFDDLFGNIDSFRQVRDSLETILQVGDKSGSYTVTLPTSLNLDYDYNFWNNFYLNVAGRFDLTSLVPADYRVNYPSSITITPRYETGYAGFYLPFYRNLDGDSELGAALRYGAFTIGTQSLGSLFSKEKKSGGVFFSINLKQLKANSKKTYCFGSSRVGSGFARSERTPLYKRKKFLFF